MSQRSSWRTIRKSPVPALSSSAIPSAIAGTRGNPGQTNQEQHDGRRREASSPPPAKLRQIRTTLTVIVRDSLLPRRPTSKAKSPNLSTGAFLDLIGRRPTLPHTCACSTIGAEGLNFRVRDGNGWDPFARITQNLFEDR